MPKIFYVAKTTALGVDITDAIRSFRSDGDYSLSDALSDVGIDGLCEMVIIDSDLFYYIIVRGKITYISNKLIECTEDDLRRCIQKGRCYLINFGSLDLMEYAEKLSARG